MSASLHEGAAPAETSRSPRATAPGGFAVSGLTKTYGPVRALSDVSLAFAPGEVHAVLGQNGSGKSTLVKLLSGTVSPTEGAVLAGERTVAPGSTSASARAGIITVFQELSVLPALTVAENIMLGHYPRTILGTISERRLNARAAEILDRYRIDLPLGAPCRTLSLAQLQLVEIARALGNDPRLLILDEATSSLDQPDAENLLRISRELAADGASVLFVSHRMDEVFAVADTVSVITDGALVWTGGTADTTRERLLAQLAGKALEPLERIARTPHDATGAPALTAHIPDLGDARIAVAQGEILGLAGLQGHGQKHAMRAIAGADSSRGATVAVGERKPIRRLNVTRMQRLGVAYVPEDRGTEGLILKHSVRLNATLSALRRVSRLGFLSRRAETAAADHVISLLSVKTHTSAVAVETLSGGNQQKVLIGRSLLVEPRVVLLDDPTRGIDAGAKADIYRVLRELADSGVAVVFNSTELPELVGLCDRVLVFHDDAIVAELVGDEITEPALLKNMLGA